MMTTERNPASATDKANWIYAATVQYVKQVHPDTWAEAQDAARLRWTAEHPEDPWRGHRRKGVVEWTPTATTD